MQRAIGEACVPFLGKRNINKATIDLITNSVTMYILGCIGQGRINDGTCYYDPNKNTSAELAKGHITLTIEVVPAIPIERLTFEYKFDLVKLEQIM
jgi:phage tail sheath protein FI